MTQGQFKAAYGAARQRIESFNVQNCGRVYSIGRVYRTIELGRNGVIVRGRHYSLAMAAGARRMGLKAAARLILESIA